MNATGHEKLGGSSHQWKLPEQDPSAMTRAERLSALARIFLTNLVEDPQDGTGFDVAVLDALDTLGRQFLSKVQLLLSGVICSSTVMRTVFSRHTKIGLVPR